MKQGKLKQLCSLMIATVLLICCAMQYVAPAGEVQAETSDEPVYSETTGLLKLDKTEVVISANGDSGSDLDVSIPENETYYMSFDLQINSAANAIYMADRGGQQRFLFQTGQVALLKIDPEMDGDTGKDGNWYISGDKGFTNGTRVTFKSEKDKVTLWIGGNKIAENISLQESLGSVTPKITWAQEQTTMKNVKIWTPKDEPVYSADTGELKYNEDTVELAAEAANRLLSIGCSWYKSRLGSNEESARNEGDNLD